MCRERERGEPVELSRRSHIKYAEHFNQNLKKKKNGNKKEKLRTK